MKIFTCLSAALLCTAISAQAATVNYKVSGDFLLGYFPIQKKVLSDFFGVPNESQLTIPFEVNFLVDTDTQATVIDDNVVMRHYAYTDSIDRADVTLGDAQFTTVQTPVHEPPLKENFVQMINHSSGVDTFNVKAGQNSAASPTLFNHFVVPVNQIVGGVAIENATIELLSANFYAPSLTDLGVALLDGNENLLGNTLVKIRMDLGFGWQDIDLLATGSQLEVSQVPVPAAAWLFGSALIGLVGFKRKRA